MSTLYLIGGTGYLGAELVKGLATAEGFSDRKALVRDESKAKHLKDLGWKIATVADIQAVTADDLVDAKVVVSALNGANYIAAESALVMAAKKAGASLFVPSEFGSDFRRWGSEFPLFAGKKKVFDLANQEGLPTLCVFVGYFSDHIFNLLAKPEDGSVTVVGDGSANLSFTRRSDIGFVLAKALTDPKYNKGGFLSMEGDNMAWKDALDLYAKVSGVKFNIKTLDPEEALKLEQDLLKKGLEGDMGAFFGSFRLHLLGEVARGNRGLDVSEEATTLGVKLETLEETLQSVYGNK
eukprot:scaffold2499_cov125-Cylindrotheca_fusiformis.AAC.22